MPVFRRFPLGFWVIRRFYSRLFTSKGISRGYPKYQLHALGQQYFRLLTSSCWFNTWLWRVDSPQLPRENPQRHYYLLEL